MDDVRRRTTDFKILLVIIAVTLLYGVLALLTLRSPESLGKQCISLMYTFNDLYDLQDKESKWLSLIDKELQDDFRLDNDSRMISTYFKFKNKPTKVEFVYSSNSVIVYKVKNENIAEDRLFMFTFRISKGRLTSIREYELKGVSKGGTDII